jgi:hypothetical protein
VPGSILLADAFDDPAAGVLPTASSQPDKYAQGYVEGQYFIRKIDPNWPFVPFADLPGTYSDASVGIDVRVTGESASRSANLKCRGRYQLVVQPDGRLFRLGRFDGSTEVVLRDWQPASAIRRGNGTNRLELACVGNTIAASINGTVVAAVQDGTYQTGAMSVGVSGAAGTSEARFDNLVVTQRSPSEPPPAAPPPPRPGAVLLADNFDDPTLGWLDASAYSGGEYAVRGAFAEWALPGSFADVTVAVDARLVGDTTNRAVAVYCRARSSEGGRLYYQFTVIPADGVFLLQRADSAAGVALVGRTQSAAIRAGNATNRLELSCIGTTISAKINGTEVASVQDGTHTSGRVSIGAGPFGGAGAVDARFDNLVVTQR